MTQNRMFELLRLAKCPEDEAATISIEAGTGQWLVCWRWHENYYPIAAGETVESAVENAIGDLLSRAWFTNGN